MRKQNLMLFPPEIAAEFVAEQEGFEPMAYKCPTGHWTIGFGHARNVHEGDIITRREAYDLLDRDLQHTQEELATLIHIDPSLVARSSRRILESPMAQAIGLF